jgi:hypothetical protein
VQAAGIALIPFIDTVELDAPLPDSGGYGVAREPSKLQRRAPTYTTLPNSPDWLRLISQAPGNNVADNYFYDTSQGSGVKLYIIDTGFFSNVTQNVSRQGPTPNGGFTLTFS